LLHNVESRFGDDLLMSSGVMTENVSTQLCRQKELISMTASMTVLSLNPTKEINKLLDICFKNIRENGHVQINICVYWNPRS
jgi:hypothetical protein